ncbi:MAG: hypothetical protein MR364_08390 [Oscillospiraceae bacterium]|nr:hypothetical protein [Oscillospiraceae bacterium]
MFKENNIPGMEEKAMGKKKLFGNNINPSCKYCELGKAGEGDKIICEKFGEVKAYDSCKKFVYNPLKRIPKKELSLANSAVNDIDF